MQHYNFCILILLLVLLETTQTIGCNPKWRHCGSSKPGGATFKLEKQVCIAASFSWSSVHVNFLSYISLLSSSFCFVSQSWKLPSCFLERTRKHGCLSGGDFSCCEPSQYEQVRLSVFLQSPCVWDSIFIIPTHCPDHTWHYQTVNLFKECCNGLTLKVWPGITLSFG